MQGVVEAVHHLTELMVQHICVLVDGQLEALLSRCPFLVVLGNLVLVLVEDLETETLLGLIVVVLAVLQLQA